MTGVFKRKLGHIWLTPLSGHLIGIIAHLDAGKHFVFLGHQSAVIVVRVTELVFSSQQFNPVAIRVLLHVLPPIIFCQAFIVAGIFHFTQVEQRIRITRILLSRLFQVVDCFLDVLSIVKRNAHDV